VEPLPAIRPEGIQVAGTTSPGADEDHVPSVPHSLVQGDAETFGRTDGA
jgi:hypothetical protein